MTLRTTAINFSVKYTFLVCILISTIGNVSAQQRAQFTQYMFNGLILNPAYAGTEEALSLTFVNRSQWGSIDGAPVTQTLSGHTLFKNKNLGVGLSFMNDKIGVHKNQNLMTSFSYHLKVSPVSWVSMGLQGGFNMLKSDYLSIMGKNVLVDPVLNSSFSRTDFNLGMGVYYRSPRLHVGLSVPEVIPQRFTMSDSVSITLKKAQFFLFSKYRIPLTDNLDFEPGVLLKYLHGVPFSYDLNACFVIKKALTLGLSYRKKESVDFLLKAQFTQQLLAGYSYDYATGEVSSVSRGSHELMVNYLFKYTRNKIVSPR
jgi:type IX secretion system PorP/SprF family membrane protein